jgi:outer membrane protein assembly factor BamB
MKLLPLFLFICLSIFPQQQTDIPWPTLANSPWPMIKHDPQLTGRSPYKGPQTPTVIWTADMTNGIFSGPVIGADDNLYFGSYFQDLFSIGISDSFYCYYPTGTRKWVYKLGTSKPPQTGIVIDSSGNIYFGALDKYIYALNSEGILQWKYLTDAPVPELAFPNIDLDGNIYISSYDGYLYSLSPEGELNWRVNYENFSSRSAAISPDGSTLYIPGRDSNLCAISKDGTLKWRFTSGIIHKAPIVDSEGNIYFIPDKAPQYLYSLLSDGNIRWKFYLQNLGDFELYSMPVIDHQGNISFIALDTIASTYHQLISLDFQGNFRWSYLLNDPEEYDDFWQPLICDNEGTIYFGSTHGHNYFAISSEGTLKWKLPLEFPVKQVDNTGAIAKDGTLFIGVHATSLGTGYTKTLYAIKDTGSVGVDDNEATILQYSLEHNYPNPFNPSTKISYTLKEEGNVKLLIYDIKGELISTLVNERQQSGSYEVDFTLPGSISTGVYIYRLTVSDNSHNKIFSDVKKMIYLK